jgi:FAD/FMN-containing dehydrogenase
VSELLDHLRGVVGAANLLAGGDLGTWEVDWRKRWRGRALAVARPGSTAEVAQVVRLCAEHGTAIVPQGGNTGLVGGSVPDDSGRELLLSLARLDRVRGLDAANMTMTVEAGCVLQRAQQAAADAGLLLALSLGAEGSCTIGGNLATNAGGTQVLRYGNAREQCLGLEVVTAAGEVWDGLTGLRKDNTGYDLARPDDRQRGHARHHHRGDDEAATAAGLLTALATLATLDAAVSLLSLARSMLGPGLTGFEVMNAFSLELVRKRFPTLRQPLPPAPWTVLLEQSDAESESHGAAALEALLSAALERGLIDDTAIASNIEQANAMWHLRESITLAQAEEGPNIKHDISLPVSAIRDFVTAADAALQSALPGIRLVNFGHLGDGNLHYNVQCPEGDDALEFLRHEAEVNRIVYDAVGARNGSISAEHGIGRLKLGEMSTRKSPVALAMMRAIKAALDPAGVLNPGRVLPPPATP